MTGFTFTRYPSTIAEMLTTIMYRSAVVPIAFCSIDSYSKSHQESAGHLHPKSVPCILNDVSREDENLNF